MADGALRADVISALSGTAGVTVTQIAPDTIEVSKANEPLRTFKLKSVVSRGLLFEFERYYGTPMAAFYPLPFRDTQKNAG